MIFDSPMLVEEEKRLYFEGIELFNGQHYFDAHEAWENIWHYAGGLKKDFYQGMIQAAVALEHYRRSNPRGVVSLHRSCHRRLAGVPAVCMGLDVPRFLCDMEQVLRPVVSADPLPGRGEIHLDVSLAPRICLAYDPFENGEAERLGRISAAAGRR
ncbi:MAG: DUF309 domain-containing protein [Tepidisphaeraceae bacterium]|jgi:hypothetical protein